MVSKTENEQLDEILNEMRTLNTTLNHVEAYLDYITTILSRVHNINMAELEAERIIRQR